MRVGIVHNAYRVRGGEEAVVERESRLLSEAGVTVRRFEVDSRVAAATLGDRLRLVAGPGLGWNGSIAARAAAWAQRERLDIVHVHNVHPILTAATPDAIGRLGIPIVATLHNRRLLCADGTFERNGTRCTACIGGAVAPAIARGCGGGRARAVAWAAGRGRASRRGTWTDRVTRFIAPSRSVFEDHLVGGLPADRMVLRPHVVPDPESGGTPCERTPFAAASGAVYVGRLDASKGIADLIDRWPDGGPILTVIGDGPLADTLACGAGPAIRFLGRVEPDAVAQHVRRARVLLQPSRVHESFGLAAAEAAACGRACISFAHGGALDVIVDGVSGRLVRAGDFDGLVAAALDLIARPRVAARMGRAGRRRYETHWSPKIGLGTLLEIYRAAAEARTTSVAAAAGCRG